jgi:hypothetical protein
LHRLALQSRIELKKRGEKELQEEKNIELPEKTEAQKSKKQKNRVLNS